MAREPVVIPEKIFFKIGEVCELVGVQAHVLRYWETEFPMLSPQKNKSGQRSYRRRDVEVALRIKTLLYDEMFTIAGARKKLQTEQRSGGANKVKPAAEKPAPAPAVENSRKVEAPTLFDNLVEPQPPRMETVRSIPPVVARQSEQSPELSGNERDAIKTIAAHLLELREMLKTQRLS